MKLCKINLPRNIPMHLYLSFFKIIFKKSFSKIEGKKMKMTPVGARMTDVKFLDLISRKQAHYKHQTLQTSNENSTPRKISIYIFLNTYL